MLTNLFMSNRIAYQGNFHHLVSRPCISLFYRHWHTWSFAVTNTYLAVPVSYGHKRRKTQVPSAFGNLCMHANGQYFGQQPGFAALIRHETST
jgi:hypothetical protein